MPYYSDRTQETTTSTGTTAITLSGTAPTGFQTFAAGLGSTSKTVGYVIEGTSQWEVGKGTFNGTTGLTRDTVRSSSNSGSLVNFSAGTKNVYIDASSEQIDNANIGYQIVQVRGWALP